MTTKLSGIVNLKKLKEEGVWVPFYKEPFQLKVAFLDPQSWRKLIKETSVMRYNPILGRKEESVDDESFSQAFAHKVILDWNGLTKEVLQVLFPQTAVEGDVPDGGVPCTVDNKVWLLQSSSTFDRWLTDVATNAQSYAQTDKKEAYDNLGI